MCVVYLVKYVYLSSIEIIQTLTKILYHVIPNPPKNIHHLKKHQHLQNLAC